MRWIQKEGGAARKRRPRPNERVRQERVPSLKLSFPPRAPRPALPRRAHSLTDTMATTAPPPPLPTSRVALASRADVAKLHALLTTTSRRALRV